MNDDRSISEAMARSLAAKVVAFAATLPAEEADVLRQLIRLAGTALMERGAAVEVSGYGIGAVSPLAVGAAPGNPGAANVADFTTASLVFQRITYSWLSGGKSATDDWSQRS